MVRGSGAGGVLGLGFVFLFFLSIAITLFFLCQPTCGVSFKSHVLNEKSKHGNTPFSRQWKNGPRQMGLDAPQRNPFVPKMVPLERR